MESVQTELIELKNANLTVQNDMDSLRTELSKQADTQSVGVAQLRSSLNMLPEQLASLCRSATPGAAECNAVQPVIVSNGKMLVGELERVWLEPPGISLTARVDTGAFSNSLNAEQMVEFERDGNDWVRFNIRNEKNAAIEIERKVLRRVRVFQQSDREGTRRPVVKLRVVLGDIAGSFEFTLADRSHLDNPVLLGRNFLTDVALVDVGQQFVQQAYSGNNPVSGNKD